MSLFRRRAYEPVREPRVPGLPEERGVRPAAPDEDPCGRGPLPRRYGIAGGWLRRAPADGQQRQEARP